MVWVDEDSKPHIGPGADPRFVALLCTPTLLLLEPRRRREMVLILLIIIVVVSVPSSLRDGMQLVLGHDDGLVEFLRRPPRRTASKLICVIDQLKGNGSINTGGLSAPEKLSVGGVNRGHDELIGLVFGSFGILGDIHRIIRELDIAAPARGLSAIIETCVGLLADVEGRQAITTGGDFGHPGRDGIISLDA